MPAARLSQPLTIDDMLLYLFWTIQTNAGRVLVQLCETEFGISRREWRVLAHLASREGLQPSELALRTGLDRCVDRPGAQEAGATHSPARQSARGDAAADG